MNIISITVYFARLAHAAGRVAWINRATDEVQFLIEGISPRINAHQWIRCEDRD